MEPMGSIILAPVSGRVTCGTYNKDTDSFCDGEFGPAYDESDRLLYAYECRQCKQRIPYPVLQDLVKGIEYGTRS